MVRQYFLLNKQACSGVLLLLYFRYVMFYNGDVGSISWPISLKIGSLSDHPESFSPQLRLYC